MDKYKLMENEKYLIDLNGYSKEDKVKIIFCKKK